MIPVEAVEAAHPVRTTCPGCGGDGSSPEKDCACPGWVAVDDIAHADLKAIFADNDISLGAPK